jgi:hypothetical protein
MAVRKPAGREVESPIPEAAAPVWEAGSAQQVQEDSEGKGVPAAWVQRTPSPPDTMGSAMTGVPTSRTCG